MLPGTQLAHNLASPLRPTGFGRDANEIRASIGRIEAELAIISRLRGNNELSQNMTGQQQQLLGGKHKSM